MKHTRIILLQPRPISDMSAYAPVLFFYNGGGETPRCAVTTLHSKNVTTQKPEGGLNGGTGAALHPSQAFWMHATRTFQNMACLRHRSPVFTITSRCGGAVPTSDTKRRARYASGDSTH